MATRPNGWGPYALGVALGVPAVVVVALVYWTYQRPLVLGFVPALVISAYIGGLRGGLTATLVAVLGTIVVMPMVGAPSVTDGVEAARVVMLGTVGIVIAVLSERLHRVARDAKRTEERFQQMFYASPVANSVIRLSDGVVIDVNEAFLAMFGVTRETIVGKSTAAAGIDVAATDRAALFARVRAREVLRCEVS